MAEWFDVIVRISGICLAGILMIFLGKYDQKKKLSPWLKVILQGIISVIVILVGVRIEFLRDSSGSYWYLANLSIPLTIAWLLIITNSVGQTNELSSLTPIIVFIASVTFLIVSVFQRQGLILAEILSVLLAIFSLFVIYLKKKQLNNSIGFSKYYMFFGFMLAIIAIVGVLKSTAALTLLTPFLILGLPIIDASYSFFSGYFNDSYLEAMNESKIIQQLISQGFSLRGSKAIIVFTSVYLSIIAIVISVWENVYLFTGMTALWFVGFHWLKTQVANGNNIITVDNKRQKIKLFDVPIDRINCNQAMERIDKFISEKNPSYVVTPDTLAVLRARKDKKYLSITKKASLVTPDGAGLLWATATLENPLIERITGIDLINRICQSSVEKGYRLFLLGAKEDIINKAVVNLEKKYPGINIVGFHHGYFKQEGYTGNQYEKNEKDIIREIKEKKPDFLLVGLGVPKQEIWISKYKDLLNVPVCIGIGGSFDVLSGKIPRAPLWMQNHGMEWIYRLIKEPKRIKRVIALPYFMWLIILGKIELYFRVNE